MLLLNQLVCLHERSLEDEEEVLQLRGSLVSNVRALFLEVLPLKILLLLHKNLLHLKHEGALSLQHEREIVDDGFWGYLGKRSVVGFACARPASFRPNEVF